MRDNSYRVSKRYRSRVYKNAQRSLRTRTTSQHTFVIQSLNTTSFHSFSVTINLSLTIRYQEFEAVLAMSKPEGGGQPNGAQTEPNQGLNPAPDQKPNQRPNQRPGVPPPSTNSSSHYINDDHFSQMHYPLASPRVTNVTPGQGEQWTLPREMNDRKALYKIGEPQWPLRIAFSKDKVQDRILTNHFTYTLTAEKLYEYKILGLPEKGVNRRVKQQHFETAVNALPFLEQVKEHFATNGVDTIIS